MLDNLEAILLNQAPARLGLTAIHELRAQLKGRELEEDNVVPLLVARIAELELALEFSDAILNAAKERIQRVCPKELP